MPTSQRPFFLSSVFAAFRQQPPSASAITVSSQTSKSQSTSSTSYGSSSAAGPRTISTSTSTATSQSTPPRAGVMNQLPLHSPRGPHGIPIPGGGRRRGSDSSSEGFRDALGAEKWYIGGRTAGGDEKFFKLGVVRRVRSNDRLSLDRLSL